MRKTMQTIRLRSESNHITWTPAFTLRPPPPLNSDYPSCPFGMRVGDLPRHWADAGQSVPTGTLKIPPTKREAIQSDYAAGLSRADLVRRHDVHPRTINRIVLETRVKE